MPNATFVSTGSRWGPTKRTRCIFVKAAFRKPWLPHRLRSSHPQDKFSTTSTSSPTTSPWKVSFPTIQTWKTPSSRNLRLCGTCSSKNYRKNGRRLPNNWTKSKASVWSKLSTTEASLMTSRMTTIPRLPPNSLKPRMAARLLSRPKTKPSTPSKEKATRPAMMRTSTPR